MKTFDILKLINNIQTNNINERRGIHLVRDIILDLDYDTIKSVRRKQSFGHRIAQDDVYYSRKRLFVDTFGRNSITTGRAKQYQISTTNYLMQIKSHRFRRKMSRPIIVFKDGKVISSLSPIDVEPLLMPEQFAANKKHTTMLSNIVQQARNQMEAGSLTKGQAIMIIMKSWMRFNALGYRINLKHYISKSGRVKDLYINHYIGDLSQKHLRHKINIDSTIKLIGQKEKRESAPREVNPLLGSHGFTQVGFTTSDLEQATERLGQQRWLTSAGQQYQ